MKLTNLLAVIGLALLGYACTAADPVHYPISGEECGPDDPVLDLTAQQCAPAA